jgi:archaellum component FlaC
VEWLQVFTIVAALLGVVGVQTTWVIHALERLDGRLDRIDDRFDRVDDRFDRIDDRFDRIDDRFARLEKDVIRDHGERISRLEARIE